MLNNPHLNPHLNPDLPSPEAPISEWSQEDLLAEHARLRILMGDPATASDEILTRFCEVIATLRRRTSGPPKAKPTPRSGSRVKPKVKSLAELMALTPTSNSK